MAERSAFRLQFEGWSDNDNDDNYALRPDLVEALLQPETPPRRFAPPTTDEQVEQAKQAAIPLKTQKDTTWCIKIWRDWAEQRSSVQDITSVTLTELQQLLSKFTLEVRKVTGEPYPPNTLHHIICGLLRF